MHISQINVPHYHSQRKLSAVVFIIRLSTFGIWDLFFSYAKLRFLISTSYSHKLGFVMYANSNSLIRPFYPSKHCVMMQRTMNLATVHCSEGIMTLWNNGMSTGLFLGKAFVPGPSHFRVSGQSNAS